MKWNLLENQEKLLKEIPRERELSANRQDLFKQVLPVNDNNLGVKPLSSETPQRISLLSHFSFTFLVIAIVAGALAGAGWYFRDSALASVVINKYLDHQIESGLVGHWTFDGADMTATTALDKSGNGNTGTLYNFATSSRVAGKLSQALRFVNGVDQAIGAGSAAQLDNMPQMTITAWINPVTLGQGNSGIIVSKGCNNFGWCLQVGNGSTANLKFHSEWLSPGNWQSDPLIHLNEWQFVAVTYSNVSATNDPTFYINGVLVSSTETSAPNTLLISESLQDISIGNDTVMFKDFDGNIDDVRIYNRILSPKEIKRLYKLGEGTKINVSPKTAETDGLVGYWTFDGMDITGTSTVLDRSPSHATGTMVSMATTSRVSGKHGQALQFDGQNDYIYFSQSSSLNNLNQKTVALWIKPINSHGIPFVSKKSTQGWELSRSEYGGIEYTQSTNGTTGWWYSGNPDLTNNTWVHVAITYDRSSIANIPIFYVNGRAVTTNTLFSPTGTIQNENGNFKLANQSFQGTLDDVRIYNRILSAEEIQNLYSAGAGVKHGICGEGGVRDADGNVYGIVQIGTQCWLDRNMNVGTRINGATSQTNNATIEKYCYNDTASNCTDAHPKWPDGGLYQWNEAMQYVTTEGAQGICPSGWHIPTDTELYTLENYLKDNSASCNGSRSFSYDCASAGTKLAPSGNSLFEANLAGYASAGSFNTRESFGVFWSSSEAGTDAWDRLVVSGNTQIARSPVVKSEAFSVRCIKDSN